MGDSGSERSVEETRVEPYPMFTVRYSLRTLMVVPAGVGLCIVVGKAMGPAVSTALAVASAIVFAHVAGNALGTRLRQGSHPGSQPPLDHSGSRSPHAVAATKTTFAPVTRLSQRTSLGWFLPIATGLGALAGVGVAGWWMWTRYHDVATPGTLFVGCGAVGVFTGLWTFWVFSLAQVFLGAWWQAHRFTAGKVKQE